MPDFSVRRCVTRYHVISSLLCSFWILCASAAAGAAPPLSAAGGPVCRYDIAAVPPEESLNRRLHLDIRVTCLGVTSDRLAAREPESASHLDALEPGGDSLALVGDGAELRQGGYRLYLGELAAQQHGDRELSTYGDAHVSTLAYFLIPPASPPEDLQMELIVTTGEGVKFATALPRNQGVYRFNIRDFYYGGYTVWGDFELETVSLPAPGSLQVGAENAGAETELQVVMFAEHRETKAPLLMEWISEMAGYTAAFWDGFPAENALLFLEPVRNEATVPFGMVRAGGGATIMLKVGTEITRPYLYAKDWVLLHEFAHLGIPFIAGRRPWFMEGMATYLEPLIRARSGLRSEASVWREWFRGMPIGVRGLRRSGLNRGGNPYWGGAIYFLKADLEIRKASRGARGIEDCLKGVRTRVGNATKVRRLPDILAACDAALGNTIASDMAEQYGNSSVEIDLNGLWQQLGVHREGRVVHYNNQSDLAYVRDTIFRGAVAWQDDGKPRTTQ